jgi:hypothetical protein
MSDVPEPANTCAAIIEFDICAKWMIENIDESWKSWQYIAHKCPESLVLAQQPGTFLPFGLQEILDRIRVRSSWAEVRAKFDADPALARASERWKEWLKLRSEVQANLLSLVRIICREITATKWNDGRGIDPILAIETHGIDRLPLDAQKSIYETARRQAVAFGFYLESANRGLLTAARKEQPKAQQPADDPILPKQATIQDIWNAYPWIVGRARGRVRGNLNNATRGKDWATGTTRIGGDSSKWYAAQIVREVVAKEAKKYGK